MHWFTLTQSALLCLSTVTSAAHLSVSIPPSPPLLPNPATLPSSTHATLQGPPGVQHDARLTRSNTLDFKDLVPGSYLLTIYTRDYFFQPYRVDVSVAEDIVDVQDTSAQAAATAAAGRGGGQQLVQVFQTFRANEWSNRGVKIGEGRGPGAITVEIKPSSKKEFYEARGGCTYYYLTLSCPTLPFPVVARSCYMAKRKSRKRRKTHASRRTCQ